MKLFIIIISIGFSSLSYSFSLFKTKAKAQAQEKLRCQQALTSIERRVSLEKTLTQQTRNLMEAIEKNDLNKVDEILTSNHIVSKIESSKNIKKVAGKSEEKTPEDTVADSSEKETPKDAVADSSKKATPTILDINRGDRNGMPPIYLAASLNRRPLVKRLIEANANINEPNPFSGHGTALHIAAKNGYYDLAEFLIEEGADVDALTSYGESPMFWAAKELRHKIIILLAKNGASIVENKFKESPLHLAASSRSNRREDQLKTYQALIDAGDDPHKKDISKKTPIDIEKSKFKRAEGALLQKRVPIVIISPKETEAEPYVENGSSNPNEKPDATTEKTPGTTEKKS